MTWTRVGSNQTVTVLPTGTVVFFSYATPVAAFIPGRGYLRTATLYSRTTTKHINRWVDNCVEVVPQDVIDDLLA